MPTISSRCLCGEVAWEAGGAFDLFTHCHCVRCRKAHGSAFTSTVLASAEAFRFLQGKQHVVRYESVPGLFRPFCDRCGSKVPSGDVWNDRVSLAAAMLEGDPETPPLAHFFVASKAPWHEITDSLPRFDGHATGTDFKTFADLEPRDPPKAGASRGSCLCGAVAYLLQGKSVFCHNCHCLRCRRAKSAAYASNLFAPADGLRFTRGEDNLATYKLREAQFFSQSFCRTCGSPMPHFSHDRGLAIVPMGSLDDDPGARPMRHVFVGSKARWFEITDELPRFAARPEDA